jgi:ribosome biogenesis GTPase
MIVDTPGIREVGLIDADEGVRAAFDDIETLPQDCKFSDCSRNLPATAIN